MDYDKIKITMPLNTLDIMGNDIKLFNLNTNQFCNKIFEYYYNVLQNEIKIFETELFKLNFTDNISKNKILKIYLFVRLEGYLKKRNISGKILSFKLNKNNSFKFKQLEENIEGTTAFFRFLFTTYANLPKEKREEVIFSLS